MVKFKAEIHLLSLCIILVLLPNQVHVWEEKKSLIHKASCKKEIVAETGSLHHPPPHDHSKSCCFPAIANEPKEMKSILKVRQYCQNIGLPEPLLLSPKIHFAAPHFPGIPR